MKRIKGLLLVLVVLLLPGIVHASSGSISISGSSSAIVGNRVTVTVTLSSSSGNIGSWEMDLSYDSSYLTLIESGAESGGTSMVGYASGGSGISSKSYTFAFRTKKAGSTTISVNNYSAYDYDMAKMDLSSSSKTITIKTQAEVEASYSDNANLRDLSIDAGDIEVKLTPDFNKDTLEYTTEVDNDVKIITINARKDDSNATISGIGEKELVEGNNRFEIVVTAQKGNSKTYVINIERKELNPISVNINGKVYTYVRNAERLSIFNNFTNTTVKVDEEEIPALYSELLDITLVGVKDDEGNVYMYTFKDGKIDTIYQEITSSTFGIIPLALKQNDLFKNYIIKKIDINGVEVEAYVLKNNSKIAIIYGKSVETGKDDYYFYDIKNNTIMLYNNEIDKFYETRIQNYKYVLAGFLGFIVLLLLILLIRKPKKKKEKKKDLENKEDIIINEIPHEEKEEIAKENLLDENTKKKEKKKRKETSK